MPRGRRPRRRRHAAARAGSPARNRRGAGRAAERRVPRRGAADAAGGRRGAGGPRAGQRPHDRRRRRQHRRAGRATTAWWWSTPARRRTSEQGAGGDQGAGARQGNPLGASTRRSHADHIGGNEAVSKAGRTVNGNLAAVVGARERQRAHDRRQGARRRRARTTPTSRSSRDFPFNGEPVMLYSRRVGDAPMPTSMVFFRRSDVIVAGDVFSTTSYPEIDARQRRQRCRARSPRSTASSTWRCRARCCRRRHLRHPRSRPRQRRGRRRDVPRHAGHRQRPHPRHGREEDDARRRCKAARPTLDYDGRYGSRQRAVDDGDVHRERSTTEFSNDEQLLRRARAVRCSRCHRPSLGGGLVGADRRMSPGSTAGQARGGGRRPGGAPAPPRTARDAGADRLHRQLGGGRHRGLALAHGDAAARATYASVPRQRRGAQGRRRRGTSRADNAAGNQCKAFGVGGIMRQPGRIRIVVAGRADAEARVRRRHADAPAATSIAPPGRRRQRRRGRASRWPTWEGPGVGRGARRSATRACPGGGAARPVPGSGGGGQGLRGGPPPRGTRADQLAAATLKVDHHQLPRRLPAQERRALQRGGDHHRVHPPPADASQRRQLAARRHHRRGPALPDAAVLHEHALQARGRRVASSRRLRARRRRRCR